MEDAIYGGRVDNIFDMRVLTAYLRLFFTQKVVFGSDRGTTILQNININNKLTLLLFLQRNNSWYSSSDAFITRFRLVQESDNTTTRW